MKKIAVFTGWKIGVFKLSLIALGLCLFIPGQSIGQLPGQTLSREKFKSPDNISKPLTWWHWINGNVTKAGIKKDLLDMKRVGIGGVQLFDAHMYLPKGPVRYGTDNWYAHVQYAIKMCDSLGLEFYIANSPGWSGSGGPWITIDKSMKQLVYSETDINGGNTADLALHQPYAHQGFYKDIAILAVPADDDGSREIREKLLKIYADSNAISLQGLYDEDYKTGVEFHPEKNALPSVMFAFKELVSINSVAIDLIAEGKNLSLTGIIEASVDGRKFEALTKFSYVDHLAFSGNFTLSFSPATCKFLRIKFDGTQIGGSGFKINEIKLRKLNNLDDWYKRTGMSNAPFLTKELLREGNEKGLSSNEIIDLTKDFDPLTGKLKKISLSKGRWTILRFGYTSTGKKIHPAVEEGTGYEVDKLDPAAVTYQFNQSLGRIIKEAGGLTGKTFKGVLFDSFEGGFQNWTDKMPALFRKYNGYDIKAYLPVLAGRTIDNKLVSSGFLWDFEQTLTNMFADIYYRTMQSLANRNHLQLFSETQGGPMSPANGNRFVDVPMNEFWTDGIEKREQLIKQTVSIANVLGKNVVAAESFTSKPEYGKWQNLPENLKIIGDYAFTTGINKFIFHTYTHQPYDVVPGFTMGRYGTHFGRTNTWWKYASGWMDYIGRSQYLLQQGCIVSDVCYLFPADAVYQFPPDVSKLPDGFNYDIIYPPYLSNIKVEDKRMILPSGAKYRLMILPDYPYMPLETLQKLEKLIHAGAIVLGPPPIASPDRLGFSKDRKKFDRLVRQLWGDLNGTTRKKRLHGKGKIYWGQSIDTLLSANKIAPDVIFGTQNTDSLKYIHRSADNVDIYFISNQSAASRSLHLSLRANGKQPQIWNALTGETQNLSATAAGARTNVPLQMDPKGAAFIVLSADFEKQVPLLKQSRDEVSTLEITSAWKLKFRDGRGAPESMSMPQLKLWNENENPAIKYYSGTAEYNNVFSLKKQLSDQETIFLDFEEIYDVAEVIINGKSAGVIWKKPYRLDVTPYLKKGENKLRVLVVNRWINRLIGDEFIPADLHYENKGSKFSIGRLLELPGWLTDKSIARTDQRSTFTTWKHFDKESVLVKSGLLGKVKLTTVK